MYEYEEPKKPKKNDKKVVESRIEATIQKAEVPKKAEKDYSKLMVAVDNLIYMLKGNGLMSTELIAVIEEMKKVK
jgi:hypothetical protein